MAASLTPDQVAAYWTDGFLTPLRVLPDDEAISVRAEIEATEAHWADGDGRLPRPFADYARANFHVVSSTAARIAHHPAVLDAVESIIGPDILCWMAELIAKEPHTSKVLTMHQDLTYWGLDAGDGLVTAWIALTDTTIDNGAMCFVRGSHRLGQVEHVDTFGADNLLSRGQDVAVEYDPADEVAVELAAGEMSLHHGLMFHGSGPNTTDDRRIGLVIRYVSPAVTQAVASHDYAMVVRGVNRSQHLMSTAVPVDDFTDAGLALHAEITAAQEAPLAAGAQTAPSYLR